MNRTKIPALPIFLLIYAIGSIFNFFITPNPYAALHSGGVALDSLVRSKTFAIQSNIITIGCIFFTFVYCNRKKIVIPFLPLSFAFIILLSGFVNGVLLSRSVTYLYDCIAFLMIAAIAKYDTAKFFSSRYLHKIYIAALFMFGFSVVLALLRPDIWGALPFKFSRDSRGEVTLAAMTGALAMLPSLIFSQHTASFTKKMVFFLPILIVIASTATRSVLASMLIPLILFSMFRLRAVQRILALASIIFLVTLFYIVIGNIFILEKTNSTVLEATLTGRAELWSYYWFKFISSPYFGSGSFLLERSLNYTGDAISEIGLLKTAAENGVFAAALQLFAVLFACVSAVRSLRNKYSTAVELFTSFFVLAFTPNFILQDHARILNSTDAVYWYSVFFHVYLYMPIFRTSYLSRNAKFRLERDRRSLWQRA